jgi:hypothetical protein
VNFNFSQRRKEALRRKEKLHLFREPLRFCPADGGGFARKKQELNMLIYVQELF